VSLDMRELIVTGFQDSVDLGCSKTAACAMVGMDIRRLQRWQETPQDRRLGGIQNASQALTEKEKDSWSRPSRPPSIGICRCVRPG